MNCLRMAWKVEKEDALNISFGTLKSGGFLSNQEMKSHWDAV